MLEEIDVPSKGASQFAIFLEYKNITNLKHRPQFISEDCCCVF